MDSNIHPSYVRRSEFRAMGVDPVAAGRGRPRPCLRTGSYRRCGPAPTSSRTSGCFGNRPDGRLPWAMRSGQSFGDASSEVMTDVDLLNEAMSREVPKGNQTGGSQETVHRHLPRKATWGYGTNYKGLQWQPEGAPAPIFPARQIAEVESRILGQPGLARGQCWSRSWIGAARDSTGLSNAHWRYPAPRLSELVGRFMKNISFHPILSFCDGVGSARWRWSGWLDHH